MCGDETPKIRCHQCGASQYMCHTCDVAIHKHQPLHDREMWCDGTFRAIPPTTVGCEASSNLLSTQSMDSSLYNCVCDNRLSIIQECASHSAFHGDVLFVKSEH